jgi:hypothetical protein
MLWAQCVYRVHRGQTVRTYPTLSSTAAILRLSLSPRRISVSAVPFPALSLPLGLSLPGVRLVTWTMLAVINWCFGCHRLVFLTIRPTRVDTPGGQIGYMDRTGCHQLGQQQLG